MRESKLQSLLVQGIKKANGVVLCKVGTLREGRGWPDLFISHKEFIGWVELKGPKTKIRPEQVQRIRMLRESGCPAFLLRVVESGALIVEDGIIDPRHRDWLIEGFSGSPSCCVRILKELGQKAKRQKAKCGYII